MQTPTFLSDKLRSSGAGRLRRQAGQSEKASARIVEYLPGKYLALSVFAALEIVEKPEFFFVPGAADYALGMMLWHEEHWIPLLDFAKMAEPMADLNGKRVLVPPAYALVCAYRAVGEETGSASASISYGALGLNALPKTIAVDNGMGCALDSENSFLEKVSISAFLYQGVPVPIVDSGRLFSRCYSS